LEICERENQNLVFVRKTSRQPAADAPSEGENAVFHGPKRPIRDTISMLSPRDGYLFAARKGSYRNTSGQKTASGNG